MNGLEYHEASGDELGGGLFVILSLLVHFSIFYFFITFVLQCLSFNGSGFIGSGSYCSYMAGVNSKYVGIQAMLLSGG